MTRFARGAAAAAAVVLVFLLAVPAAAYLKLGTRVGNRTVSMQWRQFPVRYYITDAECSRRHSAAVSGCRDARLQHLAGRGEHRSLLDLCRVRAVAAVCRGRRERDRIPLPIEPGHDARGDEVHGRRDRRSHRRVGHLLQYVFSVVHCRGRRYRWLRRRIDRAPRDRASVRPVALGAWRDRTRFGRTPRHRGRSP